MNKSRNRKIGKTHNHCRIISPQRPCCLSLLPLLLSSSHLSLSPFPLLAHQHPHILLHPCIILREPTCRGIVACAQDDLGRPVLSSLDILREVLMREARIACRGGGVEMSRESLAGRGRGAGWALGAAQRGDAQTGFGRLGTDVRNSTSAA